MTHYEIVLLIHPDQSAQVPGMLDRFKDLIKKSGGKIHRQEDWGRRQLAYPINKLYKAHYLLLNIECTKPVLEELNHAFHYNDAIVRSLVVKCKQAVKTPSPMLKEVERTAAPTSSSQQRPKAPVEEYVEQEQT